MIRYTQKVIDDDRRQPYSMEVDGETYFFPDELFVHLEGRTGEDLEIITIDKNGETETETRKIRWVKQVWTMSLEDKDVRELVRDVND